MNKTTFTIIAFFITLVILLASPVVNAQSFGLSNEMYKKVEKNIIASLNHDVEAIAESAIFNLIILKNRFPQADVSTFVDELNEISVESNSSKVRYKAQLVSWYISNFKNIGTIEIIEKDKPNKYFNKIADQLQTNLIAMK